MLDLKNLTISIPDRAVSALERIASALERAYPAPKTLAKNYIKRDASSVSSYGDNENLWNREQLSGTAKARGLSPEAEAQLLSELRAVTSDDLPPEL